MTWARLNDRVNSDPKIRCLSNEAFRLWVCGLVYSNQELTDGFIPDDALAMFPVKPKGVKPRMILELTTSLVRARQPLWERVPDGYQIHDYHDWNDAREDVLKAREKTRERMSKMRGLRRGDGVTTDEQPPSRTGERTPSVRVPTPHHSTPTDQNQEQKIKPFRAKTPRSAGDSPLFDGFWMAYPRKVKRTDTFRVWQKLAPDGALVGRIMSALEWQVRSHDWTKDGGKYIPYPTSWLNGRRWEDEPPTALSDADPNAAMWERLGVR